VLAPVVLAALFAPVCHGQLAPPTPVEQAMRYRRLFGLPAERAHVRRVQRSDARRDDQGFAFTPREWRYWRKRSRIELSSKQRLERYLDRRRGLLGGTSIEDDWPRGPYLLIQVTRDRARHDAAMKRIYPHRLRTELVQYAHADLRALQDRISADRELLEAEGFDVRILGVDTEANRVRVHMVSARADHEAYFQARYGPAVSTFATAEATRLACTKVRRVRVSSTGRSLRLDFIGDDLDHLELTEHDDRVEIGIVLREDVFFVSGVARPAHTRVQLSQPLGDRRLVDAGTGRTIEE
jgi:hypothetical protein